MTTEEKNKLFTKVLDGSITDIKLEELIESNIGMEDFRALVKRLFDMNPGTIVNKSQANSGVLFKFNKLGKWVKNNKFKRKKRKKGFRDGKKLILAEGDSWFEYPVFIKDIIDWIIKLSDYPVLSLAYGGDWISNIIYEEEYIEELSKYQPDIFLISGGGNDLVGDERLSQMVNKPSMVNINWKPEDHEHFEKIKDLNFNNGEVDSEKRARMIVHGRKFYSEAFYGYLKMTELMYRVLFRNIMKSNKFEGMKVITQGYDFAVPSKNRNFFRQPVRTLFKNGKWLYYPLINKGISDSFDQESIVSAMIHDFNEMMIKVAGNVNDKNNKHSGRNLVYHIDSRGVLKKKEWADELHPRRRVFRKIAEVYLKCVNGEKPETGSPFVFRVKDYTS